MSNTVLIVGATSGIARAAASEFARHGHDLVLAGRDVAELERAAADIRLRHAVSVLVRPFEALDYTGHADLFSGGPELAGALICHGYLGEQRRAEEDFAEALRIIDINYASAASVLHAAAAHFEPRGRGFICALSSVAGDRGRMSNYVYGSAKGALTLFLQGLRNRLHRSGVRVITVKPGFVDTAMTYGQLKGGPLVASPERVAAGLYRAIRTGREVVYLPGFWRWIMLVIRMVPETIFKRLRL